MYRPFDEHGRNEAPRLERRWNWNAVGGQRPKAFQESAEIPDPGVPCPLRQGPPRSWSGVHKQIVNINVYSEFWCRSHGFVLLLSTLAGLATNLEIAKASIAEVPFLSCQACDAEPQAADAALE